MKNKLLLILSVFLAFGFKNFPKIKVSLITAGLINFVEVKSQGFLPSNNFDGSYTLFRYTSVPTPTYGNRWDAVKLQVDTIRLKSKGLYVDSLPKRLDLISNTSTGLVLVKRGTGELVNTGFDTLKTFLESNLTIPYSNLSGTPSIPAAQVNSDWNSTSGVSEILNKPTLFSGITASTGISVTNASVITNTAPDQVITLTAGNDDITISGIYPNFTITPYIPTTYTVNRSINSSTFQVSATRRCSVFYNVGISCTANIGSNAAGTVQLQYSIDGGSTWLNAPRIKNANTVTLAIALQSVNDQEVIVGMLNIPAGAILRLVPTTSGTTTITYILGFETY